MAPSPTVLLIGLDSADPSMLRKWSGEGYLPNLRKLMQTGQVTNMGSVAPEFPDEVWPSIYTSQNAAQTGKYYYIQIKPGTLEFQMLDDKALGTQFWVTASKHGKRCAVLDVPKTALGTAINGIQLANWGAHATRCQMASHPPELLDTVLARYGAYPLSTCDMHSRTLREYRVLRRQLLAGIELRGRMLRDLLVSEPWDLFFCGFSETHCAGHQLWHLQHERDLSDEGSDLRTAMRDVYQAVDRGVGALVDAAGPESRVVVFSGHGMQPQYHGRDVLPTLLELWGLSGPNNIDPDPAHERRIVAKKELVQRLKEAVPIRWQYAVKSLLPQKIEHAAISRTMGRGKLDPRARAFVVPNNELVATIRINLAGREPHGLVPPGRPYDELCQWIITRFRELINPVTGKPAITKISRMKDSYHGPHMNLLPDLTARWSGEASLDEVWSPGYGTVVAPHRDRRTGGHAEQGILIVRGVPQDMALHLDDACGKDLAPTALHLLGVPIPDNMEGRSLMAAPAPSLTS